jgi:hypothetical protein
VRIVRLSGWQLALLAILAVVLLVALTIVLFWVGLLLALAVGLVLLNVLYLPRAAAMVGTSAGQLALWLLPAAAVIGWLVAGGASGMAWGAGIWLVAIAAPRLAIAYLARRFRQRVWGGPPPGGPFLPAGPPPDQVLRPTETVGEVAPPQR